jgi:hypothetical protein
MTTTTSSRKAPSNHTLCALIACMGGNVSDDCEFDATYAVKLTREDEIALGLHQTLDRRGCFAHLVVIRRSCNAVTHMIVQQGDGNLLGF